jgi:hypothetical protein
LRKTLLFCQLHFSQVKLNRKKISGKRMVMQALQCRVQEIPKTDPAVQAILAEILYPLKL